LSVFSDFFQAMARTINLSQAGITQPQPILKVSNQ